MRPVLCSHRVFRPLTEILDIALGGGDTKVRPLRNSEMQYKSKRFQWHRPLACGRRSLSLAAFPQAGSLCHSNIGFIIILK
jgi:hypothetical protein